MSLIRDLFTGTDNRRWELARVMGAWSIIAYSSAFLFSVYVKGANPDWASLGTGFGAVLLGAGAMIGIKDIANPVNRKPGISVDNVEEVNVNPGGGSSQ